MVDPSHPGKSRPRPHLVWKRETHGDKAVASAGSGNAATAVDTSKTGFQKVEILRSFISARKVP
jgi:hypothetical protein